MLHLSDFRFESNSINRVGPAVQDEEEKLQVNVDATLRKANGAELNNDRNSFRG